jgi:hypothetical protein
MCSMIRPSTRSSTPSGVRAARPTPPLLAVLRWVRLGIAVVGGVFVVAVFGGVDLLAPPGHGQPATHVALDILPVRPGGPATQYAAYQPSTVLTVPAKEVVTITIRNFDLDPTTLPADSPYLAVQGTVGGVASVDGIAYHTLDRQHVAHTFTIPDLHLNVPIPGRAMGGKPYVTIQFQVRTNKAGVYSWRCFAPCGVGGEGQAGPMAEDGYMRGTLFVQA